MAESFLIALREGFEAALIVAIVLAFVRRQAPEHARAVWLGTGGALVVATAVGLILHATIDGPGGPGPDADLRGHLPLRRRRC